jgi:hypothetical protein
VVQTQTVTTQLAPMLAPVKPAMSSCRARTLRQMDVQVCVKVLENVQMHVVQDRWVQTVCHISRTSMFHDCVFGLLRVYTPA